MTNLLWYVYRFNGPAEEWECLGAFSREDESRQCLADARAEWKNTTSGSMMADELFPGGCVRQTWSEFCERIYQYRLREIAAPIEVLARAAGWPANSG
jgi:hypothetical protein